MSKITEGTPVTAPITPGMDDSNEWPTHSAKFGEGGLEVVNTKKERDAITAARKKDKLVLVRSDDTGEYAFFECRDDGTWHYVQLPGAIRIVDKDGSSISDVTSIKFPQGTVGTDQSGNTTITFPQPQATIGNGVSITDGFGKTKVLSAFTVLGSLLKENSDGTVSLEIADGVSVQGSDGLEIDGVKQFLFPQATVTHDDDTGDTEVAFDLNPGFTVRGVKGVANKGVKDIMFRRAKIYIDPKDKRAYVDTMTGVDVDANGDLFNGVERLNFNYFKAVKVHQDGSLYLTPDPMQFVDLTPVANEEGNTTAFSGEGRKISTKAPLRISRDPNDKEGVVIDIDPSEYEGQHEPSYLGFLSYPTTLVSSVPGEFSSRGFLWLDETAYHNSGMFIHLDKDNRSIGLVKVPDSRLAEDSYYFAYKVHIGEAAQVDGMISIAFVDATNTDLPLKDVEGNQIFKSVSVKTGEIAGDIYIDGILTITNDTTFKLEVSSTAGKLAINGKADGMTGLVLQRLSDNETSSPALVQWVEDVGLAPVITKYDLKSEFLKMPSMTSLKAEGFGDAKTHPKDSVLKTLDNWNLYSSDSFVTKWDADDFLYVDNTDWMYFGAVVDSVRTKFLANDGQKAVVKAKLKPFAPNYWLVIAEWTGDPDKATFPIATGYDENSHLIYNAGWSQLSYQGIGASGNLTEVDVSEEFDVPFSAKNVAFFFVPQTAVKGAVQFGIKDMSISPVNEKVHYKIEHMANDRPAYKTFSALMTQVGGKPQALPITTKPMDVTFYVAGLELHKEGSAAVFMERNYNGIRFGLSGEVLVSFSAMMNVVQKVSGLRYTNNGQGNVRFYAERFDVDGNSKGIIMASKRLIWLPEQHGGITPQITFPVTVAANDRVRFFVVADRSGVVELEYLPGISGDKDLVGSITATYLSRGRVNYGDPESYFSQGSIY